MSDLDRFENQDSEVLYRGKNVLFMSNKKAGTVSVYVLAKDPVGNEYFAYETGASAGKRGLPLVLEAMHAELKERG